MEPLLTPWFVKSQRRSEDMLQLSPAGRFEIERRYMHAKALVDMCDGAARHVPLLESSLCAARAWGEGLYSNMPTEAEAERGRELQAKLDSHLERTLLFRRTKETAGHGHHPFDSRNQQRISELLGNTGLNETRCRQLLHDLCENSEHGEEPLLRQDILAGKGRKSLTMAKLRQAQAASPRCACVLLWHGRRNGLMSMPFAASGLRKNHSRTWLAVLCITPR